MNRNGLPIQMHDDEPAVDSAMQLSLIADMINKAKAGVNQNGIAAIMWGTVVSVAGFWNYCIVTYDWPRFMDPWLLCLLALIPQAYLVWKEKRQRPFKRHEEDVINSVWAVYGISIGLMVIYMNLVPYTTQEIWKDLGTTVTIVQASKSPEPYLPFPPSSMSLMLILYFIPTMVMGMGVKVKPMLVGALCNLVFFAISLFTITRFDFLLASATGIGNWLIPGIIMRRQYLKAQRNSHV